MSGMTIKQALAVIQTEVNWHAGSDTHYRAERLEQSLATLRAEIDGLRAEVRWQKRVVSAHAELHGEAKARAERLAEALRKLEEREQSDEALLRQALEALERGAWDTLSGRNAAFAIRERLGLEQEEGHEP